MKRSAAAVIALGALALLALAAPALASASYDNLPGESLGGNGFYESATVFDQTTPAFDTEPFSVEQAELNAPPAYLSCNHAWGGKDAWVRFATGVSGNLYVDASKSTPGDLFYIVYTAPTADPVFTDLTQLNCESGHQGPDESYAFGYDIPAHSVAFVQVLDTCNTDEPCSKDQLKDAEGGETEVRLRFTRYNADGDNFPDTTDRCPTTPGAFNGCPDSDGDGVGDADDSCPSVFGRAANGCRRGDEDGDGYAVPADCNDNNPAINPGAVDAPGDGIDQNCDGHDSAYPVLKNEVDHVLAFSRSRGRTVGFLSPLKVAGPLVPGILVRLICKGRGCPFSREAEAIHKSEPGGISIGKKLVGQTLSPGVAVTLLLTRPGYVGEAIRFTIRKHGKARIEELCTPPGTTTPKQCG